MVEYCGVYARLFGERPRRVWFQIGLMDALAYAYELCAVLEDAAEYVEVRGLGNLEFRIRFVWVCPVGHVEAIIPQAKRPGRPVGAS